MSEQVRKICLLGDFSVGKTSTVRRFVEACYDDKYLTTVGVKIDTKTLQVDVNGVAIPYKFIIWDIAGTDTATPAYRSYLKGMAAYLLVVDGCRLETLDNALQLQTQLEQEIGHCPWVGLLNKADLTEQWAIDIERELALKGQWLKTSAKTGQNVDEAFAELARQLA